MSADERAFFSAIRAAPEEDAPRLIYADWLEENGNSSRAEFIRLQCAIANQGDDVPLPLLDRERELWLAHGSSWCENLPEELRGPFHRGFPQVLTVRIEDLLRSPQTYLDATPFERVRLLEVETRHIHFLAEMEPTLLADLDCRAGGRLELTLPDVLQMLGGVGRVGLAWQAGFASPPTPFEQLLPRGRAPTLRRLRIERPFVEEISWLDRVIESHLPALQSLSVRSCFNLASEFGTNRIRFVQPLVELELTACRLRRQSLMGLFDQFLPEMHTLCLRDCQLPASACAELVECLLPLDLQTLDLSGNFPDWDCLQALLLTNRRRLRRLFLTDCGLRNPHLEALDGITPTIALRCLDLSRNAITNLRPLLQAGFCPELRTLRLAGNPLRDDWVGLLAERGPWGELRTLDLAEVELGSRGAIALAEAGWCRSLRSLILRGNQIGTAGASALAGSSVLGHLHHLDVRDNEIGPAGERALLERFGSQVLEW